MRQGGGEAEAVGQPIGLGDLTEFSFEEFRAVEHLTYKRLARGDVGIRFDPDVAADIPLTCRDLLFQLLVYLGIVALHHVIKHRFALTEGHLGVDIHERGDVGEGSRALTDALLHSPKPGNVNVAVTCEHNSALGAPLDLRYPFKVKLPCAVH